MEGYKSFKEAVESVQSEGRVWKYLGNETERFSFDELIQTAEFYDRTFPADEWNYFVTFPTGEIGIFSCEDGDVEMLFVAAQDEPATAPSEPEPAVPEASPLPEEQPEPEVPQFRTPKFCRECGSKTVPGDKFCSNCGRKFR